MKLIDFDGLFDEKLAQYMAQNKNKHTEREWENVIPKLYKKFGDTRIAKIGCTPKEYYARMSDIELVETLKAHLIEDVPVPEFLCTEIDLVSAALVKHGIALCYSIVHRRESQRSNPDRIVFDYPGLIMEQADCFIQRIIPMLRTI